MSKTDQSIENGGNAGDKPPLVDIVKLRPAEDPMNYWLLPWINKRIRERRPVNIVFTGETGSGKSYQAMSLAAKVDPDFSVDRIVFDIASFLHILNERPPPGSVIIYDEAGVELGNKDYRSEQTILFSKTAQTMRYRGIIIFYTIPRRSFLDNTTRQLVQLMLETTMERGVSKMLLIKPSSNRNDNDPWYQYPSRVMTTSDYHTYRVEYRTVRIEMPPKKIYIPYEKKKDEFLTPFYQESERKILERASESVSKGQEKGVRLECQNCGYVFQYTKASWDVKCPRCKSKIDIEPSLRPFIGVIHAPLVYNGTGASTVNEQDSGSGDADNEEDVGASSEQ